MVAVSRVVDVSAVRPDGSVQIGSGYIIESGLILTAQHVVTKTGTRFSGFIARSVDDGAEWPCELVWLGGNDLDAALLKIIQLRDRLEVPPVPWGVLVSSGVGITCEAIGFPRAMRHKSGVRDTEHVSGRINPATGAIVGRLHVDVESATPKQGQGLWRGMSGAAMFCGPLLTGVVIQDHPQYASRRLVVEPVTRMLEDGDFSRLVGDPRVEIVELFGDSLQSPMSSPPREKSLGFLLRADEEAVRFRDRTELTQLMEWCDGDGFRALLITGPGGHGKTRLARQLDRRLRARKWAVGWIGRSANLSLVHGVRRKLLLIVDYAETRPDQVRDLVEAMRRESGSVAIRLLLLARGAGDWWERLSTETAELQRVWPLITCVMPLAELESTVAGRGQAWDEAVQDLRVALREAGQSCASPSDIRPPDLSPVEFGSPLTLQTTALVALLGESASPSRPLEKIILDHEARYWRRRAAWHELPNTEDDVLREAVAAATLCGALSETEALELLKHVFVLRDQTTIVRKGFAHWLHDLYPPPLSVSEGGQGPPYWGSLQPDLLAEYLVAKVVQAEPGFLCALLESAKPHQSHQALTVINRAAVSRDELRSTLPELLAMLPELTPVGAQVAVQSENPDPLLSAMTALVATQQLSIQVATATGDAIPLRTRRFADFALTVQRQLTTALRKEGTNRSGLARSLINLSVRLEEVGERDEALDASSEAVQLGRELAEQDAAHLPLLAGAMDKHSGCLAWAGRHNEALRVSSEAVRLYRDLLSERPAYLPDLAAALSNHATRLRATGRWVEALSASTEAVGLCRGLANLDPDAYLHDLIMSIDIHTAQLFEAQRNSEALEANGEAVRLICELGDTDQNMYLPDLAQLLDHRSNFLALVGRGPEALDTSTKAVELYRELVKVNRRVYLPDLAAALTNRVQKLADAGREGEALETNAEAVRLYRELTGYHRVAHLDGLAISLFHFGTSLARAGRVAEALQASTEAVTLYRELHMITPQRFQNNLADGLQLQMLLLSANGQRTAALRAGMEATSLRQKGIQPT